MNDKNRKKDDKNIVELAAAALRDTPVPTGPPADTLANVLAAEDQQAGRDKITSVKSRRFTMKSISKIAALILIPVCLAAVAVVIFNQSADVAFAEVRDRIRAVQTMTLNSEMTLRLPGREQPWIITARHSVKPGVMRVDYDFQEGGKMVGVVDIEHGKMLTLRPEDKKAMFVDMGEISEQAKARNMNMAAEMKKLIEGRDQPLGIKQIDGRRAKGFRVTHMNQKMDLWVDAKTGDPIRMEMDFPGLGSAVMTDIVFDVELDDSLFTLIPPDDYEILNLKTDIGGAPEEKDLLDGLRFFAGYNGGVYPADPRVPTELMQSESFKQEAGEWAELSEEQRMQKTMDMMKPFMRIGIFIQTVAGDSWHYQGGGVSVGDADTPICWYQPAGSATYRVVYGDLTVKDVSPEELPETDGGQ